MLVKLLAPAVANKDPLDLPASLVAMETPEDPELPETREPTESMLAPESSMHHTHLSANAKAFPDQLVAVDHQAPLAVLDSLVALDSLELLDPKDNLAQVDPLDPLETVDPLEHLAALDSSCPPLLHPLDALVPLAAPEPLVALDSPAVLEAMDALDREEPKETEDNPDRLAALEAPEPLDSPVKPEPLEAAITAHLPVWPLDTFEGRRETREDQGFCSRCFVVFMLSVLSQFFKTKA